MNDLVERLTSYADDADEHGGVPNGSDLVPIHKTTLREIVAALSRADELAEAVAAAELAAHKTYIGWEHIAVPKERWSLVRDALSSYRSARGETKG